MTKFYVEGQTSRDKSVNRLCMDTIGGTAVVRLKELAALEAAYQRAMKVVEAAIEAIGYVTCPRGNLCKDPSCECQGRGYTDQATFQPDKYAQPLADAIREFEEGEKP